MMPKGKNGVAIPKVVIERLPRYYRYFEWLEGQVEKVSSRKLGELLGSSASQVRLDLSYFGDFGQQGYGYNVKKLRMEIAKILSINESKKFIIIGAGNIGTSLSSYKMFERLEFTLKAIFDINPKLIGKKVNNVLILDVKELSTYIRENDIDIAIMAVPEAIADDVAHMVVASGIKGIMNFVPIDLDVPNDFPVENIHLVDEMLALSFIISNED